MADSRSAARRLIVEGRVAVSGVVAPKPSTMVGPDAAVTLVEPAGRFVGRGGEKLAYALEAFDIDAGGVRAIDLGASTGGFTDCLLQAGAVHVVAVDVGYNQLDYRLRTDRRVTVLERTNARTLDVDALDPPFDVIVADLSFISLELVMGTINRLTGDHSDVVLLVKPQFEVGKDEVGRGGVVREPVLWARAVGRVVTAAAGYGLGLRGLVVSPLRGASAGNREFLVWLRRGDSARDVAEFEGVFALAEGEVT